MRLQMNTLCTIYMYVHTAYLHLVIHAYVQLKTAMKIYYIPSIIVTIALQFTKHFIPQGCKVFLISTKKFLLPSGTVSLTILISNEA